MKYSPILKKGNCMTTTENKVLKTGVLQEALALVDCSICLLAGERNRQVQERENLSWLNCKSH